MYQQLNFSQKVNNPCLFEKLKQSKFISLNSQINYNYAFLEKVEESVLVFKFYI